MRCWCGYLSGATCRLFAYGPADATHSHTQLFNGLLSGTTRVGRYHKKHSTTHTHSDHWTSIYQLPPSTTTHSILCVQFTCLAVLFDNLSPGPLWSPSWSWTLNFITAPAIRHLMTDIRRVKRCIIIILHAFLHPIIIFFSQYMPILSQPVLL